MSVATAAKRACLTVGADMKPTGHFGVTLGCSLLYLKLSDVVRDRTFEVKQTRQGPTFGLGFYS